MHIEIVVIWITLDSTLKCFTLTVSGLVGKVDFTVRHLSSSTTAFTNTFSFSSTEPCIGNGVHQVGKQFVTSIHLSFYHDLAIW